MELTIQIFELSVLCQFNFRTIGYSKAISLYSKIGEVYLNFDQAELNTVEILVVRLNYKIDAKLCDQLENLKLVATPTTGSIIWIQIIYPGVA